MSLVGSLRPWHVFVCDGAVGVDGACGRACVVCAQVVGCRMGGISAVQCDGRSSRILVLYVILGGGLGRLCGACVQMVMLVSVETWGSGMVVRVV